MGPGRPMAVRVLLTWLMPHRAVRRYDAMNEVYLTVIDRMAERGGRRLHAVK